MRKLQIVLSLLSCLCVVAAVIVGSFVQNLYFVLALMLAAVIFGAAMFVVRNKANEREDAESGKNRPDFMNTPAPRSADTQDGSVPSPRSENKNEEANPALRSENKKADSNSVPRS
ncbi:MAG TPA: hypothetical protein H9670_01795 [Firmicutes bacterium]|nr:hypothetical protein [Bacillota bacterium]